jgi:hypothetical protein
MSARFLPPHSGMSHIGKGVLVKGFLQKWLLFAHFPTNCNYFYNIEKNTVLQMVSEDEAGNTNNKLLSYL